MAPLRLGLFGGTFDPPHHGHHIVAHDVVENLQLDRLLLIPAGLPPHKQERPLTSGPLRVQMVRALLTGDEVLELSDVEMDRIGPSFTVDTLRLFRSTYPDAEIFFIMGVDQAATFQDWHEPEEVASLAHLVVLAREGGEVPGGTFITTPVTRVDISSSTIRDRVREGKTIRHLVPGGVREIIESNRLYRATT